MADFFNKIRVPHSVSGPKKIIYPLIVLVFGIILGIISKVLDETASNLFPQIIQYFDFGNFFGRMGVWIFTAACISIYSNNHIRAGINVLLFFAGMVSSYYLYTVFVAGFFPKSYITVWVVITLFTPFSGAMCWYAKGTHIISVALGSIFYAVMGMTAFSLQSDFSYFGIAHGLELVLFLAAIGILYVNITQILKVALIGTVLFVLLHYTPLTVYIF